VQEAVVRTLKASAVRSALTIAALLACVSLASRAQQTPSTTTSSPPGDATTNAVRDLQDQVRQLRTLVEEMRSENVQSRAEMQQLRQELQTTRSLLERPAMARKEEQPAVAESATSSSSALEPEASGQISAHSISGLENRVQKLEDTTELLGAKVDEQHQTKIESASKYRARISGIILMNAFRNAGGSDNLDFPNFALPSASDASASFGATLRQSEIGLEIFGPTVWGAKTSANVRLDFAGGFPDTANGVNFGLDRLQTASVRLDWDHTSVIAGQDSLFISPNSPTSFASLATPAFAYAGNLWGWTPQVRVEHRFDLADRQTFTVQAGIMDNLSWEPPSNSYKRSAQAGEQTGQPAYAVRTAWSRPVFERPLSFGVAGYYGRQNWTWDRYVDAWAGMADWQIPIAPRLALSGEFYRGRGAGGLGAGIGRAVLFGGNPFDPTSPIHGLDSVGGWSQLKLQITPKIEVNGVFAEDNAFAGDVRGFAIDANNFSTIQGRNRGALGNVVFRPRSDLLFSAEFRRLHSFPIYSNSEVTNQVNLAVGILF
jgi:hypothetical protein